MNSTDKNYIGFLPANDGVIFVDKYGGINERIGIAYYIDEYGYTCCDYIDAHGDICPLASEFPSETILGKKGDTITFADLRLAFKVEDDASLVIPAAEKYLKIAKDGLEDTIVISFDLIHADCARMDIRTKTFPYLDCYFFDLSQDDYRIKEEDGESLNNVLIPVLAEYSRFIGKRVKVEIYIDKSYGHYYTGEKLKHEHLKVIQNEEMYLPRLRRYINEELDKELLMYEENEKNNARRREKYNKIYETLQTKYDSDPNLM